MHDVSALTNRISKNYKRLTKWARRYGISCFRVYDSDIKKLFSWYGLLKSRDMLDFEASEESSEEESEENA